MTFDKREMLRCATSDASDFVRLITVDDLYRDTPCEGWTVADLVAHMIGQNIGFAKAVRSGDADRSDYKPADLYAWGWPESVESLHSSFDDAPDDKLVRIVELGEDALSVDVALTAQIVDTVVHAWDLAVALNRDYEPCPGTVAFVLSIAELIPDDNTRLRGDAAFAPAVPSVGAGWSRALALLGRQRRWRSTETSHSR